jgi:steroid delta-isomerase-like uncharacterized protein
MKNLCMILPLALILCFIVGCQDKEAMAELEAMKAQAALEEQNKEIVKRWVEQGFNKGNLDMADEFYATDYVYHNPAPPPAEIRGVENIKQHMAAFLVAFPDAKYTIVDAIAKGDKIVARYTFIGTHEGELMGIPPTGKQVTFNAMAIIRIVEGKFVEEWGFIDTATFMQQLGMELKPKGTE